MRYYKGRKASRKVRCLAVRGIRFASLHVLPLFGVYSHSFVRLFILGHEAASISRIKASRSLAVPRTRHHDASVPLGTYTPRAALTVVVIAKFEETVQFLAETFCGMASIRSRSDTHTARAKEQNAPASFSEFRLIADMRLRAFNSAKPAVMLHSSEMTCAITPYELFSATPYELLFATPYELVFTALCQTTRACKLV